MGMSRKDIVQIYWASALDQEGWYPPLVKALQGLSEEQADWRPDVGPANSIRETVDHLIFYKEQLLKRLQGQDPPDPPSNDATFAGDDVQDRDWERTVARLVEVHRAIAAHAANGGEEGLDRPLPEVPLGGQMLTLAMHDAYHTGQIIQLRKLQGSWPARTHYGG